MTTLNLYREAFIDDEDLESLRAFSGAAATTADNLRDVGTQMRDVEDLQDENAAAAVQGITAGGTDSKPLKKHVFDEAVMADITPSTKAAAFILFHNRGRFLNARS